MRITTRILLGFGTLLVLTLALILYQIYAIGRLQSTNALLSGTDQRFTVASLDLIRDVYSIDAGLQNQNARAETGSPQLLKEAREDFERDLKILDGIARSPDQKTELTRLRQFWRNFVDELDSGSPGERTAWNDHLDRLLAQSTTIYQSGVRVLVEEAEKSNRTGRLARASSWAIAGLIVLICMLTSILIFRSVELPLRHLLEGTGAIASGKHYYRLDTSRSDEFSQIARDFNTLTQRLSELDQMKRSFAAHVSHELKVPVASMQETMRLMLEGIPGPLTDQQKRLLEISLQSGARLNTLVSNLLDVAKIEAGAMEYDLQSHDLIPLIGSAIAGLQPAALEKKIVIRTDAPASLYAECDRDRIVQVIGNVLSNAVKYSPPSGLVTVAAEEAASVPSSTPQTRRPNLAHLPEASKLVLLSIADSGPGIPDPQKELVFERFSSAQPGKANPGLGLGLGLTLCRAIIEAHGGAIWIEDRERKEKGTVVRILLRASTPRVQPPSRE